MRAPRIPSAAQASSNAGPPGRACLSRQGASPGTPLGVARQGDHLPAPSAAPHPGPAGPGKAARLMGRATAQDGVRRSSTPSGGTRSWCQWCAVLLDTEHTPLPSPLFLSPRLMGMGPFQVLARTATRTYRLDFPAMLRVSPMKGRPLEINDQMKLSPDSTTKLSPPRDAARLPRVQRAPAPPPPPSRLRRLRRRRRGRGPAAAVVWHRARGAGAAQAQGMAGLQCLCPVLVRWTGLGAVGDTWEPPTT